jgi:hypothetical protein
MSTSTTISGTVKDTAGVVGAFTIVAMIDSFTLGVVVVPLSAPVGTTRTLTVTPTGGIAPFTYSTPISPGLTFTPTGTPGQWTFVY